MSWIFYVLIANCLFALSSIFDKVFTTSKIKSVYSFSVLLNAVYFIFFAITAFIIRDTFVINSSFYWAILGGIIYFFMWLIYWRALKIIEVSRAAAIFFTQPVFNAFLAVWFLHETLNISKWIAIVLIVLGAFLSSWEGKAKINKGYILVLIAALMSAVGNTVAKHAMSGLPALTVNSIGFFGSVPLYLFLFSKARVRREVVKNFSNAKTLGGFFVRGLIGYLAICSFMLAVGSGQISLVSALSGTQPFFTLLFSLAAGFFMTGLIKEQTTRKAIVTKSIAILLIVAGAVIISF